MPRRPRIHLPGPPLQIVPDPRRQLPADLPTLHRAQSGAGEAARRKAYREWFRSGLDAAAVDGIRLALNQSQPLGDSRFYVRVARAVGERREARPRGRPRMVKDGAAAYVGQRELGL